MIRDPDVSFDATRVLYAHKKDLNKDDYHLYEYHLATGKTRQITSGLGMADYEGSYLPNGHIVFNSSRCVQIVDCWWTEVSNLYTCDGDGRYLRRLSFDQVHTNFPTVTADGRVIYTRWDYSDRGQIYPQALFQMNPDGTNQQSFYGNNSWFPTTILHARGIPGSQKIVCVFSGHHSRQKGWLGMLDPRRGREHRQVHLALVADSRDDRALGPDDGMTLQSHLFNTVDHVLNLLRRRSLLHDDNHLLSFLWRASSFEHRSSSKKKSPKPNGSRDREDRMSKRLRSSDP